MTQRLGQVVPAAIRAHLAIAKGRARHAAVEWAILLRLRAAGGGDGAAWTINAVAHVAIKAADLSSVITVCRALANAIAAYWLAVLRAGEPRFDERIAHRIAARRRRRHWWRRSVWRRR